MREQTDGHWGERRAMRGVGPERGVLVLVDHRARGAAPALWTGLRSEALAPSLPRGTGSMTVSRSRSGHRACAAARADDHPQLVDVLCIRRRVGAAFRRDARGRDYPMVLTDGERLVAFVHTMSGCFFLLLKVRF